MEIPQIIKETAREHGCNRVSYSGEIDGAHVFSIGCVDMNGLPIPTGLPEFLLLKDDEITIVSGYEGLDLHCKLKDMND